MDGKCGRLRRLWPRFSVAVRRTAHVSFSMYGPRMTRPVQCGGGKNRCANCSSQQCYPNASTYGRGCAKMLLPSPAGEEALNWKGELELVAGSGRLSVREKGSGEC